MILARVQDTWALLFGMIEMDGHTVCAFRSSPIHHPLQGCITRSGLYGCQLLRDMSMEFFPRLVWRSFPVQVLSGWRVKHNTLHLLIHLNRQGEEAGPPVSGEIDFAMLEASGWRTEHTLGMLIYECPINDPYLELIPGEPPKSLYR